jgi:hypothetical protein
LAAVAGFAASKVSIVIADGDDRPEGMSDRDIARFRAQANECCQLAQQAINPIDKETWLRLAGDWIKLAQEGEERQQYRSALRE